MTYRLRRSLLSLGAASLVAAAMLAPSAHAQGVSSLTADVSGPSVLTPGGSGTYTVTVTNLGPDRVTQIRANFRDAANVAFHSDLIAVSTGGSCTFSTDRRVVDCAGPFSLEPGGTLHFAVKFNVREDARCGESFGFRGQVISQNAAIVDVETVYTRIACGRYDRGSRYDDYDPYDDGRSSYDYDRSYGRTTECSNNRDDDLDRRIDQDDRGCSSFQDDSENTDSLLRLRRDQGPSYTTNYFRDVPVDAWYEPYVTRLVEQGVISGYTNSRGLPRNVFGPNDGVTYAQLAKMVVLITGRRADPYYGTSNYYAHGHWAEEYVAAAERMGLSVYQYDLDVDLQASRGDVAQTIYEAFNLRARHGATFRDVPEYDQYYTAVSTLAELGIVGGNSRGYSRYFRPYDAVNRAEISKMLVLAQDAR